MKEQCADFKVNDNCGFMCLQNVHGWLPYLMDLSMIPVLHLPGDWWNTKTLTPVETEQ